ncbi:hypothetical protein DPMN_125850 [Dreissena polymorpha]|uniref:Uncharacterized protein n=1 Tax=Dreissena polymorpha TaxID=45954 RepID=A0A9D4GW71_DREPO|nr:hypothetical protein DPMN_125850 [Dreissena polymorpha]
MMYCGKVPANFTRVRYTGRTINHRLQTSNPGLFCQARRTLCGAISQRVHLAATCVRYTYRMPPTPTLWQGIFRMDPVSRTYLILNVDLSLQGNREVLWFSKVYKVLKSHASQLVNHFPRTSSWLLGMKTLRKCSPMIATL